jgi:hypothetical protein
MKGIDSLAQLCREKLGADPFSGCLFLFRSRSGKAIRILALRWPGVLDRHEAPFPGPVPMVADRQRTCQNTTRASGAAAARRR